MGCTTSTSKQATTWDCLGEGARSGRLPSGDVQKTHPHEELGTSESRARVAYVYLAVPTPVPLCLGEPGVHVHDAFHLAFRWRAPAEGRCDLTRCVFFLLLFLQSEVPGKFRNITLPQSMVRHPLDPPLDPRPPWAHCFGPRHVPSQEPAKESLFPVSGLCRHSCPAFPITSCPFFLHRSSLNKR